MLTSFLSFPPLPCSPHLRRLHSLESRSQTITVKMDELHVGTFSKGKGEPGPKAKKGRLPAKVVKLKRTDKLYKTPPARFEGGERVRVADEREGRW